MDKGKWGREGGDVALLPASLKTFLDNNSSYGTVAKE